VVLIAELAHTLSEQVDLGGVAGFAFLFAFVWWAWLNGALYHDLHGHNDLRTRVFTFLQMFTVASMAIFAHDALGESSVGFALSFVAYQLILTYLWWRTGVHDPLHRPLSRPYSVVFLITTLLVFISVFVTSPWRFYLWALALLLSLLLPALLFNLGRNDPAVRAEVERGLVLSPAVVERFGLFTIIVLGEVIVGVVQGVTGHDELTWLIGATAILGMLVAIGLWWVYFDFVSHRPPMVKRTTVASWIYAHLLMTMGIAATGAAVLNVLEHAGEPLSSELRWLLVGAIALALICIALMMRVIRLDELFRPMYRTGGIVTLVSGLLILLLGFTGLSTIPLLVILVLLMLTPVFYGLKIWIQELGAEEITIT
jgi:low temperature requirement protein LtrA